MCYVNNIRKSFLIRHDLSKRKNICTYYKDLFKYLRVIQILLLIIISRMTAHNIYNIVNIRIQKSFLKVFISLKNFKLLFSLY